MGSVCRFQFGEFFNFVQPQEVMSGYFNFGYQLSDKLMYDGTMVISQQQTISRGSPSNPGGRIGDINDTLGGISGDHPKSFSGDDPELLQSMRKMRMEMVYRIETRTMR